MPQVWLTYAELGREIGCLEHEARAQAIETGLDRRHCSDGQTRVKLPPDQIEAYLLSYAASLFGVTRSGAPADLDAVADTLVARLREIAPARNAQRRRSA